MNYLYLNSEEFKDFDLARELVRRNIIFERTLKKDFNIKIKTLRGGALSKDGIAFLAKLKSESKSYTQE